MIMRSNVPAAIEEIGTRVGGLGTVLRAKARELLRPAAIVLLGTIRTMLSRPGTGRWYKSRGVRSRLRGRGTKARTSQLHRASAPGEPPAPDIGELRRSIGIDEEQENLRVGTPLKQAVPLEYGTKGRAAALANNLRGRRGPGVDRRHLSSRLRRASAPRGLVQSVARRGTGNLDPRPFMRPSLEEARPKMATAISAEVEVFLTQAVRALS